MTTVLIASGPLRNQPGPFREILTSAGFRCLDPPGDHTLSGEELSAILPGVEAIMAGSEILSGEVFELAPRLKVIARIGVGYDSVDIPAATARQIAVTIAPGANQESVAEHAFALLLAVTRFIVFNDRGVRAGDSSRHLPVPLRGKTLGLVGLGRIGRAMVPRALAFGMRVAAFDPMPNAAFDRQHGLTRLSFEELLAESDVVSLHLPLSAATLGLVDAAFLARMRPGSYLINTSRGALIVEADLYDNLRSGHLAGAGLDVLKHEPPRPDHPLLTLPNVVISPHVAGIDTKGLADMAELAARCIVSLFQGQWPTGCVVNDELCERWVWKNTQDG